MADVYKIGGRVSRFAGQAVEYSSNTVTASSDFLMYGQSRIEHYPGQDIVSFINADGSAEMYTVYGEVMSYRALSGS
jgi:hypothetical protein